MILYLVSLGLQFIVAIWIVSAILACGGVVLSVPLALVSSIIDMDWKLVWKNIFK